MIGMLETSLKRLKDEAKQLKNNSFIEEDIGNDLVRVYLGNAGELELLTLNQLFVYSAKLMNGSIISFINKLEQLKSACQRGTISFDYRQICLEIEITRNLIILLLVIHQHIGNYISHIIELLINRFIAISRNFKN